jgi:hypothetical protein
VRTGAILVLVAALSGCGGAAGERPPLTGKVGQSCTVQFRRGDGLGGGGSLPVGPTTTAINGAEVSVSGTLAAVTANWVVVTKESREWHIPRESILLVEFQK